MTSSSYQPLDLSKSKEKCRSTSDGAEEIAVSRGMYDSVMARQGRPLSVLNCIEHISKYGIKKDRSCNLSWSSTFGTAIPTTTIPGNVPALQRRGFVYVPPSQSFQAEEKPASLPMQNGIPSQLELSSVPSKIFSRYGIPLPSSSLSATHSDVMPANFRRLHEKACPGCCCCSNVHSTHEFGGRRQATDYITPAFTFRNNAYGIDPRNVIMPLRRDYTVPSDHPSPTARTSSKAYSYIKTEPFYDPVPKQHTGLHESMYYRPKDVCELWKYEGERIGYLPSNGSRPKQFKNTDDKKQSPKEGIPMNRDEFDNDAGDIDLKRARIDGNREDVPRIKEIIEEKPDTSIISNPSIKSIDEKNEKPHDANPCANQIMSVRCPALEKKAMNEGNSAHSHLPLRLKCKDAIGPGYIEMIAKAILNSKSKRCMLSDIYKYISTTYSRYRDDTVCWRNIVRHHLSHYECFVKAEHNGHAHYWTINPDMEQDFANGKFHRKRRPNRRKRMTPSTKIIANKSTLGSVTSPIAHWFPNRPTFHPYHQDELVKPYFFVQGQPWLNEDQLRGCYPYLIDTNLPRPPLEKCYR